MLTEIMALHLCVERALDSQMDERVMLRLQAMAGTQTAGHAGSQCQSMVGDCGTDVILPLTPGPESIPGVRIAQAAKAMGLASPAESSVHECATAGWLAGAEPRPYPSQPAWKGANAETQRVFANGGYYVLGSKLGQDDEVRLIFDAGPQGYLSHAQHSHADALSIRLRAHGHPVLVDRGSSTNDPATPWHQAFRSTRFHSTVCLDGLDQLEPSPSEQAGWCSPLNVKVECFNSDDDTGEIAASHNGYRRLTGAALHRRSVSWSREAQVFKVVDRIFRSQESRVEVLWQLSPDTVVTVDGPRARALIGDLQVDFTVKSETGAGVWELHCGNLDKALGWHAPQSGQRVPAPTLIWLALVNGDAQIETNIQLTMPTGKHP